MTDEEIIERGFKLWHGGDEAPADWDGGEVLLRDDGPLCAGKEVTSWEHSLGDDAFADIVGYKQKAVIEGVIRPHPEAREPILQFFSYLHLPEHLQRVSKPFGELAEQVFATLPRNPERTVALRKLLEAKDAAVRALLFKETN